LIGEASIGPVTTPVSAAADPTAPPPTRGVYCNRTLNLRAIRAIGYDMDYTLVHYNEGEWEKRAYEYSRTRLVEGGWPVSDLTFDPGQVIRGLIIDTELGNIVKANRFGYVKQARHGTRLLEFEDQRRVYGRTIVDLSEPRWVFLNTLFSLSEGALYGQLVARLDRRGLPDVLGYADLYRRTREAVGASHLEGRLKQDILADPERFVVPDPEAPRALLDQRRAGKKLMLITNSDWDYTRQMMSLTYDPWLPAGTTWRDLFDLVIASAAKPAFFWSRNPIFAVASEDGLLRPCPTGIPGDGAYVAGNAGMVEHYLGVDGSAILFVGDHIYGDVYASKRVRRWRAALVLRELEAEMAALAEFRPEQRRLDDLMARKEAVEGRLARVRLALHGGSTDSEAAAGVVAAGESTLAAESTVAGAAGPRPSPGELASSHRRLRAELAALDEEISPLSQAANHLVNPHWGPLLRTGNDKSHLARQMERHADIYTSRVSNFLYQTPYCYFRSPRASLPHDPGSTRDPWAR